MAPQRGQFVTFDGLLAVVVGLEGDDHVPDDHVALWFGERNPLRESEGRIGRPVPEVWTVPASMCHVAAEPEWHH